MGPRPAPGHPPAPGTAAAAARPRDPASASPRLGLLPPAARGRRHRGGLQHASPGQGHRLPTTVSINKWMLSRYIVLIFRMTAYCYHYLVCLQRMGYFGEVTPTSSLASSSCRAELAVTSPK